MNNELTELLLTQDQIDSAISCLREVTPSTVDLADVISLLSMKMAPITARIEEIEYSEWVLGNQRDNPEPVQLELFPRG